MANNHVHTVLYIVMVGQGRIVSGKCPEESGKRKKSNIVADCSYDQPSNRRRNPAPQYIESLETRLARAEALLKTVLPDVDLNDPNIDATIARQSSNAKTSQERASMSEAEQDAQLSSMIAMTGQLDLDEHGRWDFHVSTGSLFSTFDGNYSFQNFHLRMYYSPSLLLNFILLILIRSLGWLFRYGIPGLPARTIWRFTWSR